MTATTPQAVDARLTRSAIFLVATLNPARTPRPPRGLCADIAGLTRSVGVRAADDTLSCVMGIGSQAWDRLFGAPRPKELHPFREINGVHHAPPRPATCCSTCAPSAWTSVSSCPR